MRFGPRIGEKIIGSRSHWGISIKVQEGLLDQPIQRGYEPLLVHGIRGRIKGKVNFHCAVGGAQVPSPDKQPSNQAERTGVTEYVIAPSSCIGLLGYASRLGCRLPPCGSSSAKIGPPLGSEKIAKSREVSGISVDVTDNEGRSQTSEAMITDDSLNDRVSCRCSGGVAM